MTTKKTDVDNEVVEEESTTGVLESLRAAFPGLEQIDVDAAQARINARYQQALSLNELFDVMEKRETNEWAGKVITVNAVNWMTYDAPGKGLIPAAECQVTDRDTLKEDTFYTTSGGLVNFLFRAWQLGVIPFTARIEAKPTRSGQTTYNFKRV